MSRRVTLYLSVIIILKKALCPLLLGYSCITNGLLPDIKSWGQFSIFLAAFRHSPTILSGRYRCFPASLALCHLLHWYNGTGEWAILHIFWQSPSFPFYYLRNTFCYSNYASSSVAASLLIFPQSVLSLNQTSCAHLIHFLSELFSWFWYSSSLHGA